MAISAKAMNRKYWKLMPLGQNIADAGTDGITQKQCLSAVRNASNASTATLRIFIPATAPAPAVQIPSTPAMSLPARGRCAAPGLPA